MDGTRRRRILRPLAGAALLLFFFQTTLANNYVPEDAGNWKPATTVDMLTPDKAPVLFAADSSATVWKAYFTNLEPLVWNLDPRKRVSEPPPPGVLRPQTRYFWNYRRGTWTLALGPARGSAEDSGLVFQLLREADEPSTFLIMGAGMILITLGPRLRRRRVKKRSRAAR